MRKINHKFNYTREGEVRLSKFLVTVSKLPAVI